MKRLQFEHVIRAAAEIVNDEIVVVGSQAVLAHHPDAPDELLVSQEVDLFPLNAPERSDQIDGAIGDGSLFHDTYDYYAHSVGPETVIGPAGWEERLVRLELASIQRRDGAVIAWCLAMHDLVLAKLAAGRDHDFEFAEAALDHGLVDREQLLLGVDLMPETHRELVENRLSGMLKKIDRRTSD